MQKVLSRIFLAILAALIGVGLLLYSEHILKRHFSNRQDIYRNLNLLQTNLYALESEIIKDSTFIYYNYDSIHNLLNKIDDNIEGIDNFITQYSSFYKSSAKYIKRLSQAFKEYRDRVDEFLIIDASIKNSIIYIPTLQLRSYDVFNSNDKQDREALKLISKINASIFLAKNAQDLDFIKDIESYQDELGALLVNFSGNREKLLTILINHLEQFINNFDKYTKSLDFLLENTPLKESSKLINNFQKEDSGVLDRITKTTRLLLFLYLFSLVIVIYFIIKTHKENKHLIELKNQLEENLRTDTLTKLGNQLLYRKTLKTLKSPALIIVNIDRFKHINEFYGTSIGDAVLIEVAKKLQQFTPPELQASIFRMGGDDFGILFDKEEVNLSLEEIVQGYLNRLENCYINIGELTIDLSFSIGASSYKEWLFETADMALKAVKASNRKRYAIYTRDMDKREEIAKNIQTLRRIRKAIEKDRIIPYYQPIYDWKKGKIVKYESLARIILDDNKTTLQPFNFIRAANEAKLSGKIVLSILKKTLEIAKRNPDSEFTVNLSASDIIEKDEYQKIIKLLIEYQAYTKQIIFEIIESEDIQGYDTIASFIKTVKQFGCRIAIDDFGSGYSNFEKLLKLDIDIIKIDGSLIKEIDRDRNHQLIVQTILNFAKDANWQTVAEFVHSEDIYKKTIDMGFDYLQGYYIGKPSKELKKEPFGD